MLVHDGVLVAEPAGWRLTIDVDAIAIPPTIQALLASRLERLNAADRRVLEIASVVGTDFSLGAVCALTERSSAEVKGVPRSTASARARAAERGVPRRRAALALPPRPDPRRRVPPPAEVGPGGPARAAGRLGRSGWRECGVRPRRDDRPASGSRPRLPVSSWARSTSTPVDSLSGRHGATSRRPVAPSTVTSWSRQAPRRLAARPWPPPTRRSTPSCCSSVAKPSSPPVTSPRVRRSWTTSTESPARRWRRGPPAIGVSSSSTPTRTRLPGGRRTSAGRHRRVRPSQGSGGTGQGAPGARERTGPTRPGRRLRGRPLRGAHRGTAGRGPPTDHRRAWRGTERGAVGAEPRAQGRRAVSGCRPDATHDNGGAVTRGDVVALPGGAGAAARATGQGPLDAGRRPPGRRRPRPSTRADGDRAVRRDHRVDGGRPGRGRAALPNRHGRDWTHWVSAPTPVRRPPCWHVRCSRRDASTKPTGMPPKVSASPATT